MGKLLDNRLLLLLVLIVFVFCKVPHLYYPYYWDESWPYMPAVKAMHDHGISLMPNAIDADLSRGHPLFFHALAAFWMKIFGASHFAMHFFALFISLLFLIAIYEAGYRLFNPRVAFLGLVMVATQEVFFVQSSFVLLEMLVACLAFLSLCFYIKDKYVFTAITLSMLFYTKESGLVLGFVIGLDALAGLFNKQNEWGMRLFRLASVAFPCLAILIFFLLQKYQRGWYIFPFYNDIIEHSWKAFWYKFRMACVHVAFYDNYKYFYFLVLMALSLIASVKNRKIIYTVVLIPGAIIYYFVDDMRTGRLLPPIPFFMVFVLSVFYFLYVFGGRKMFELEYQRRFIRISGLFILCFLCFSTMNYFTYRYLLAVIVPLLFLTAVFYDMLLARTYKALFFPLIAIILLISFFAFKNNNDFGDANLGAFTAMDVQQGVIDFLEQNQDYDKVIGAGSFMEQQHLINPSTGYLKTGKVFNKVQWDINTNTDFAIFDNIDNDYRYNEVRKDSSFQLVYKIEKGKVWAEIFENVRLKDKKP